MLYASPFCPLLFFYVNTQWYLVYTDHTGNCACTHTRTHEQNNKKHTHQIFCERDRKSQNECIPQLYTNLSISYIMSDQCFCKVSNIWSKTVMHHVRTTTFQGHFWHSRDSKNWSTIACSTSSRDCVIKVRIKSSKGSSPDRNCGTLCKVVGPRWSVMRSWL